MDILMQPGEEVTGHIRWEQPVLSLDGYIAGEMQVWTFHIACPQGDEQDWTLTSSLPGQQAWYRPARTPDTLRKAAEEWLEVFVFSLGAVFPDPDPATTKEGQQ